MDAATTRDLCRRAQAGDLEARNRVVEGNMGLVARVAGKYGLPAGCGLTREDLLQVGMLGLMRAVERYSEQKAAFSTYATIWIRQAIGRALANVGLIRVPVYVETNKRAERRGTQPAPGVAKLADAARHAAERVAYVQSLDEKVGASYHQGTEERTLGDMVVDESQDTEGEVVAALEREHLHTLLGILLTPRQRTVLSLRFGLTDGQDRTLEEVGELVGVSRERVRQVEERAMLRLRLRLTRDDDGAVMLRGMLTRKRAA